MGNENSCSLTNEQAFVLRVMYVVMQTNDLAIMESYRFDEIIKKTKYYRQDVKNLWNAVKKDIRNYEIATKKTCVLDYLADYCDAVEEYIKPEIEEYFFSIKRFIHNNAGVTDYESELLARLIFILSLFDLAKMRLNDMNKSLDDYVSGTTGKHELSGYRIGCIDPENVRKRFMSFIDLLSDKIKSEKFDVNKSDMVCLCFRKILEKLQSEKVIIEILNNVLGIKIIEQKQSRKIKPNEPFHIGRGMFVGRQHKNLTEVKCDYCCLRGKGGCNTINCEGMYIERYKEAM